MTRKVLRINITCHATIKFSLKFCLQLHCELKYCHFLIINLEIVFYNVIFHKLIATQSPFLEQKKLDKSELKATVTQYIRRSYKRKAGAQRQFVESAVKRTEIKNSRFCTKIKKTLN